ncbi:MAG: hypothetical protein AB2693_27990 [Candidatus Thiodiazotropha sp.]
MNSVVRLTDRPDMTLAVAWDVKQQNKNNNHHSFKYFHNNKTDHLIHKCLTHSAADVAVSDSTGFVHFKGIINIIIENTK